MSAPMSTRQKIKEHLLRVSSTLELPDLVIEHFALHSFVLGPHVLSCSMFTRSYIIPDSVYYKCTADPSDWDNTLWIFVYCRTDTYCSPYYVNYCVINNKTPNKISHLACFTDKLNDNYHLLVYTCHFNGSAQSVLDPPISYGLVNFYISYTTDTHNWYNSIHPVHVPITGYDGHCSYTHYAISTISPSIKPT